MIDRRWMLSALIAPAAYLAAAGASFGCTHVFGIPAACRMHTRTCSVPGVGKTPLDSEPEVEDVIVVRMTDRWTFRAYRLSHDRLTNVLHHRDGVYVLRDGQRTFLDMNLTQHVPREWAWGPSSRRVVFWAPYELGQASRRVAILDPRSISPDVEQPWEEIYDPTQHWADDEQMHLPFGMAWSPKGNAVYVLERLFPKPEEGEVLAQGTVSSALIRLDLSNTKVTRVTEILRVPFQIDFFSPPVSRFQNGSGPSGAGYWIVFGGPDGLYLLDPKGGSTPRRFSSLPGRSVFDVEWSPTSNQLALYFRRPSTDSDGKVFRGVWLVHLDRIGHEQRLGGAFEQLDDRLDLHTLWYSPQGTYVTWSGPDLVAYRRPEDPPEQTVTVDARQPATGESLEIKGCAWHANERWLAYVAGSTLFVHDAETLQSREIKTFSRDGTDFLAAPEWVGDRVMVTLFEDVTDEAAPRSRRTFDHDRRPQPSPSPR